MRDAKDKLGTICAWIGELTWPLSGSRPKPPGVKLRRLETVPGLGSAARRSALRENRRLTRAEGCEKVSDLLFY